MHFFLQECLSNDAVLSLHPIGWHTISLCAVSDDVHFDHLIKVKSPKLLH